MPTAAAGQQRDALVSSGPTRSLSSSARKGTHMVPMTVRPSRHEPPGAAERSHAFQATEAPEQTHKGNGEAARPRDVPHCEASPASAGMQAQAVA